MRLATNCRWDQCPRSARSAIRQLLSSSEDGPCGGEQPSGGVQVGLSSDLYQSPGMNTAPLTATQQSLGRGKSSANDLRRYNLSTPAPMTPRPIIPACGDQDLGNHITLTASYAASSFAAPPARPHNLYNLVKHRAKSGFDSRTLAARSDAAVCPSPS